MNFSLEQTSFEFIGGPKDGIVISGDQESLFYFAITHQGTIGRQVSAISPASVRALQKCETTTEADTLPIQVHVYELAERIEEGDRLIARMEYVGIKKDGLKR